jgi:dienelactone hydrolase
VQQEPHYTDVPVPRVTLPLAAEVAIDDALLAWMGVTLPMRDFREVARVRKEVHEARELFRDRGWLEKPADYHQRPPELSERDVRLRPLSLRGLGYEHLRFESGYEPHPDEPGRGRWLSYAPNRTAHAWVLRHAGEARPWLVCVHGYQMGAPAIDLRAFRTAHLHYRLGLNVALPVLPLHGPRKIGRMSGDGFLSANFLDTVHAEAQAMWDLRRLLSWIRAQGAPQVGAHGLSLGGYNTALLASLDAELACAIPGIPATDFTRLTWRHGPPLHLRYAEHEGLVHDEAAEVLQVISPLTLEPLVPKERRYLFAATSDLLVPPDQVRDLWRHWGRPRIVWYPGGHVTFRLHDEVDSLFHDALRESGLVA